MAKINLAVDLTGNIDGKLKLIENALKRISDVNGKNIKIRVNDSEVDSLLRKLDGITDNISLKINSNSIRELERSLGNLKINISDSQFNELKSKLDSLKINVDVDIANDVLSQIEGLNGGRIELRVDTSDLDALEDRLARILENYLGGGSGGSDSGIGDNAVQGGILSALTGGNILRGAGVGAGVALAGQSIATSADFDRLYRVLRSSVGSDENADRLYDVARNVFRSGSVNDLDSLGSSAGSFGTLLNSSNVSDGELESLLQFNSLFGEQFDFSAPELLNTLNTLVQREGESISYYLDLLTQGFQSGTNNLRGDFLDSIQEFLSQGDLAGFSSKDLVGLYANNVTSGLFNNDLSGNSLLEFVTNISELVKLGNDNDLVDLRNNLEGIGVDFVQVQSLFSNGGVDARKALQLIIDGLLETDEATRRIVGTEIFGTPFEDGGDALLASLSGGTEYLQSFSDSATAIINENLNSTDVQIQSFRNNLVSLSATFGGELSEGLVPILSVVNTLLESLNGYLSNVGDNTNFWRDAVLGVVDPTGVLKDSFDFIGQIINGIDDDTGFWASALDIVNEKWESILEKVQKVFNFVKDGFTNGIDSVGDLFSTDSDLNLGDRLKSNSLTKFLFNLDDVEQSETSVSPNSSAGNLSGRFSGLSNNISVNSNSNLILSNGLMRQTIDNVNSRNNYLLR